MTDYSDWKILKTELDEKQEEYSEVAEWCNESGEYHIGEDEEYYKVVKNPEPLPPTEEEQRQKREQAYTKEVDPITCHIQRLQDEEQTPEVVSEIEKLKKERAEKVEEIKARFPYPVGEKQSSSDN